MSTPAGSNVTVPYVAPWAANWNKYSTQLYNVPLNGAVSAEITVPASQWWRIIYLSAEFLTSATAGTRAIALVLTTGGTTNLTLAPSATTPVSTTTFITYGLGLNTVATPVANATQFLSVALIDLLWKPKTQIQIEMIGAPVGDSLVVAPTLAVEIYTEFTSPASAPILLPTPTLT